MKQYTVAELKQIARQARKSILTMSWRAKSAHSGGALSCVEILVALYYRIMKVYPKDPENPLRDRLIFSKAHDAKVLYAVLAERGYFSKKILEKYEVDDAVLPGHSTRHCVPGIEASAGSLGHGLSMACGMALAGKLSHDKYKVYAILSDGECDEGSTWEAALFAGHHKLDNLVVIVDYNKLQGFGYIKDILNLEPFADKWKAFRWDVRSVNGHDFNDLIKTINKAPFTAGKPSVILANTVKGLGGVPKHINQITSQYKPPTDEEYALAMAKLEEK